jgi:hypothetical protein
MMVNAGSKVGHAFAATLPENAYTGFVAENEMLRSGLLFCTGIDEKPVY